MKKKIVFIGNVKLSKTLFEEVLKSKFFEISGLICSKFSKYNSDYENLAKVAKKKQIDYKFVKNINQKSNVKWIRKKNPDFIFCFGWSQIINEEILNIPKFFSIGYHPSDIPYYRGKHPLIWSIFLGLKSISSTFFVMSKKIDLGMIISKKKIFLKKNIKARDLYREVTISAQKQVRHILNKIMKGDFKLKKPKETNLSRLTIMRRRSYVDGVIDWRMDADLILKLVNSLSYPYPGASFYHYKKEYKLNDCEIIKTSLKLEPGKVIALKKNSPVIKCGKNALLLKTTHPIINLKVGKYLI